MLRRIPPRHVPFPNYHRRRGKISLFGQRRSEIWRRGDKMSKIFGGDSICLTARPGKELVDYFQCHDATQIEEREAYFAYEWVYFACFRNESLFFHGNPLRCP